jgi:AcrR family transcriptional regulator
MADEEKDILKNRIKELARTQFAKKGFSYVKTDDLAKDLGISKRTLYDHFPSKENLLSAVIDDELKAIDTQLNAIMKSELVKEGDFIGIMKKLLGLMSSQSCTFTKEFFDDIRRVAPSQWDRIEEFRMKGFKANFDLLHNLGVKNGYVKKNINKEIFFLIFSHALHNIMTPEVISKLPFTTLEVTESIIEVLLTGALTESGRERYLRK